MATSNLQPALRKRSFIITRKPELEGSAFLYNNVEVKYVGTCPETGISFYCSLRANYGVRVYPNGKKVLENPSGINYGHSYVHGKNEYLKFKCAFGYHKGILVADAVWMAAGREKKPGYSMDHINGCTTDNNLANLRCITMEQNVRDGGFLRRLRNKGFVPVRIQKCHLLRYFARMAVIKEAITRHRYDHLTRDDLSQILYLPEGHLMRYFKEKFNIEIDFTLCQMI